MARFNYLFHDVMICDYTYKFPFLNNWGSGKALIPKKTDYTTNRSILFNYKWVFTHNVLNFCIAKLLHHCRMNYVFVGYNTHKLFSVKSWKLSQVILDHELGCRTQGRLQYQFRSIASKLLNFNYVRI